MNAKLFIIAAALMLAVPAVFGVATPSNTVVDGVVYSGSNIDSAPVVGALVEVSCNGNDLSDTTDADGEWRVVYTNSACPLGSSVTACVGENCGTKDVVSSVTKFNLLEIKLFDVPEFGTAAAALSVSGAGAAYLLLRRRK